MSNFKNVDKDPIRMVEYKERQREKAVLEEYYRLKADYPDGDHGDLLNLATLKIKLKQGGVLET